jgi:phosphate transport system permease protein
MSWYKWRKLTNQVMLTLAALCAGAAIFTLITILGYVMVNGLSALNLDFFTQLPKPVGEPGGGMANAIVGSFALVGLACLVGLPIGIMGGIYLSEFGEGRLGTIVRFISDVMLGVPSIVIGIFVYVLLVIPLHSFSALAGGVALGLIMIPLITRTTEEMLKLVPRSLREASLALGIPRWRTILGVVLPSAGGGIATGVLLALARISGETAPLLFTALSSRFWHSGLGDPIASLTVYIYTYAISPFADWHAQAWGAALVLLVLILILNIAARFFIRRQRLG